MNEDLSWRRLDLNQRSDRPPFQQRWPEGSGGGGSGVGQRDMTLLLQGVPEWTTCQSGSESEASTVPSTSTLDSTHAPRSLELNNALGLGRTAVTYPEKRSGLSGAWDGGQKCSVFTGDCVPRRTNLGLGGGGSRAAMWVDAVLGVQGRTCVTESSITLQKAAGKNI